MDYAVFRKVANFYKSSNIASYPLSVRRIKLKDLDGECELKNEKFYIAINRDLNENHAIDVLIHEAAHAMSWGKDSDVHGQNWGKAYSKAYRMFLEKFVD